MDSRKKTAYLYCLACHKLWDMPDLDDTLQFTSTFNRETLCLVNIESAFAWHVFHHCVANHDFLLKRASSQSSINHSQDIRLSISFFRDDVKRSRCVGSGGIISWYSSSFQSAGYIIDPDYKAEPRWCKDRNTISCVLFFEKPQDRHVS